MRKGYLMKNRWSLLLLLLLVSGPLATAGWAAADEDEKPASAVKETSADDEDEGDDDQDSKKRKKSRIPGLVELRLDEKLISARAINLPIPGSTRTVQDLLDRLDEYAEDDKVGGILMDVGSLGLGLSDVEELRDAIGRVKKAGKKVMAFLNAGGPNAYLLACTADEIAMAPTGSVMLPGIGNVFPFQKGFFLMQGIEFQVLTAGKFKYPGFMNRREPDEYFNEEFGTLFDSMFDDYVDMIAEGRDLERDKVLEIIDKAIFKAAAAQQHGLVDTLVYYDEYRDRVLKREKMKKHRDRSDGLEDLQSIQDIMEWMNDQMQAEAEARKAVGPKIAVLHARGPIVDINLGAAVASQMICRDDFVEEVEKLRKNKSIKAVVLRIDSPGGSGYASDIIWRHLRKLDAEKPVVVSMGTVAGSGGYYIACPARKIFAQPTTITGSIGVLTILQSQRSALNRRDIEMAEIRRGKWANTGSPHRALNKEEQAMLQQHLDDFYDIFIDRVATGRKRPESEIRKVAEGRVWTGRDALEIGLVDELGGLDDAIQSARKMANIPESAELKILHYPRPGSLGELFESLGPMATMPAVETLLRGSKPAGVSFEQQLTMFSQRFQPLCWMAMPVFSSPAPTVGMGDSFMKSDAGLELFRLAP